MISLLNRKLLRDVLRMRSQVLAIVVVVACGVALLTTNVTAFQALQTAQTDYYRDYKFADIFATLKRAPLSLVARIRAIPGVREVEPRIVRELTLDVPGLDEPAMGRAISIPPHGGPLLNRLYVRRGRLPDAGSLDEAVISEAFAEANKLQIGASLGAAINGKWRRLQIVGVALSPEYIYQIKPGDLFPDNKRFGVLWLPEKALAAAFDMDGAFNDIVLSLNSGASEQSVIAEVDELLRRFGGAGAYGRKNQVSHSFVTDEIRQNRVFGMIMPGIFLGLAGFLVGTVLMRLVHIQREQIGTLKAFGFSDAKVGTHYLQLALLVVTLGWLIGSAGGSWWAGVLGEVYKEFYRFPHLHLSVQATTLLFTFTVVALTAAAGCWRAIRRATALPPAEAMRPESPVVFSAGLLERLNAARWVPLNGRMVIRNVSRYPMKAALSVLGIALGASVLLVGYYFQDALHYMADLQFRRVQKADETVLFISAENSAALREIDHLPGVLSTEPMRAVPVQIRNGYRVRRIALIGLESEGKLHRLVSQDGREHKLPLSGVVLTKKLADLLDVRGGGDVTVEALEGRRPSRAFPVTGIVDEAIGLSAYMNLHDVTDFMLEDRVASGAYLRTDATQRNRLYAALKLRPGVVSVSSRTAALTSFEETLAQTSGSFAFVFVLFATIIVFAAVYNAGRIALSERSRELASLCVLGFSRMQVSSVVIGEQALLAVTAVPLGLCMGYLIAKWISWTYTLEIFRIPFVIDPGSYLLTVLSVIVSAALSAFVVHRRILKLNLVAAIKTRE